jgi:hypothetical protein
MPSVSSTGMPAIWATGIILAVEITQKTIFDVGKL